MCTYIKYQFIVGQAGVTARLYGAAGRGAQRFGIVILINVATTQVRRALRHEPGVALLVGNLWKAKKEQDIE